MLELDILIFVCRHCSHHFGAAIFMSCRHFWILGVRKTRHAKVKQKKSYCLMMTILNINKLFQIILNVLTYRDKSLMRT